MILPDDDRAIRESAAIGTISARQQIALTGKDRLSYLQGLLTNDIQALTAGSGCYAAWLTPQGRMLTDMHVLESATMLLLDVPADLADTILQRLDQFLFSEDVQFASLADTLTALWVHGPSAPAVLERVISGSDGMGAWPEYHHAPLVFGDQPAVVVRITQLGVPGFCVYIAASHKDSLLAALEEAGAKTVSPEAVQAARIEAAYPVFGIDMTEETIPLEAGIENRAISLTKGCYVGQEIIIRVLHRGHGRVAKRLVGLRLTGGPAERGAKIFANDRDVGVVTSAAESPRLGSIALGYVHRDFTAPDTSLQVDVAGNRVVATVRGGQEGVPGGHL